MRASYDAVALAGIKLSGSSNRVAFAVRTEAAGD